MKNFIQHLKEEVDIKDIEGLDPEFMDRSTSYIRKKDEIEPDSGNLVRFGHRLMTLMAECDQILLTDESGKPFDFLQALERREEVQNLIERCIRTKYAYLIDFIEFNTRKELLFDISWTPSTEEVVAEVPKLNKKIAVSRKDLQSLDDPSFVERVSKSKIMDLIAGGEGVTAVEILKSDNFKKGLEKILDKTKAKELTRILVQIFDVSNKLNWIIPEEVRARILRNSPETIFRGVETGVWRRDEDKFFVISRSVNPLFLLYDTISGLHSILKGSSLQEHDPKLLRKYTRSHIDDLQNFRYGPIARKMYYTFVEKCIDSIEEAFGEELYRPKTRVDLYIILSRSVDSGGKFTDEEFLDLTKNIFSCFKLVGRDLKLDQKLFDDSFARNEIVGILHKLLDMANQVENIMKSMDDQEDDEIADLKDKSTERSQNPETMTQKELHDAIDAALDRGDYEMVKKLSEYLKESRVYLQELERINENFQLVQKFRK
jgi:hypothetical protein